MRRIIIIALMLASGHSPRAQYPGYLPMQDPAKFKTEFTAASLKTVSLKCDFIQEKNLAMLSEKIISKGKFLFKKESRLRMEYVLPYQYLMVINKDKVYVKDGQKENRISTKSNKMFQQINRIMIDCMQGTALDNTDFKTRVFESKSNSLVELVPVSKGMKELFKTITVTIDRKDFSVSAIQMQELSGDYTNIRFINKELNANIPDALFSVN